MDRRHRANREIVDVSVPQTVDHVFPDGQGVARNILPLTPTAPVVLALPVLIPGDKSVVNIPGLVRPMEGDTAIARRQREALGPNGLLMRRRGQWTVFWGGGRLAGRAAGADGAKLVAVGRVVRETSDNGTPVRVRIIVRDRNIDPVARVAPGDRDRGAVGTIAGVGARPLPKLKLSDAATHVIIGLVVPGQRDLPVARRCLEPLRPVGALMRRGRHCLARRTVAAGVPGAEPERVCRIVGQTFDRMGGGPRTATGNFRKVARRVVARGGGQQVAGNAAVPRVCPAQRYLAVPFSRLQSGYLARQRHLWRRLYRC